MATLTVNYDESPATGTYSYNSDNVEVISGQATLYGTTLAAGLEGYWRFEESTLSGSAGDVADASQNANNGTSYNGVGIATAGQVANCATFSAASSQYIQTQTGGYSPGTGAMTIACWFKTTASTTGTHGHFYSDYGAGANNLILLRLSENRVVGYFRDGGGQVVNVTSTSTYNDGDWHSAVLVRSSSKTLSLYIDGAMAASATNTNAGNINLGTTRNPCIGCLASDAKQLFYDGLLDEVAVWNRALTSTEIADYHNSGNGRQVFMYSNSLFHGLRGNWPCDATSWAGVADEVGDQSVESNDGQAINGATTTTGIIGNCGIFSASSSQYVRLSKDGYSPGTGAMTIACWFKSTADFTGTYGHFYSEYGAASNNLVAFRFRGNNVNAYFRDNGGDNMEATSASTYNDGNWHCAMVVRSSAGTLSLYVDDVMAGSATNSSVDDIILAGGVTPTIGALPATALLSMDGLLDEIAVWDRALTTTEMTSYYNSGAARQMYVSTYDSAQPGIYKTAGNEGTGVATWTSFTASFGAVSGSVGWQLSYNGTDWFYYSSAWITASSNTAYNTEAEVNTNIPTHSANDTIFVKAILISDGTQEVEVDSWEIEYSTTVVYANTFNVLETQTSAALSEFYFIPGDVTASQTQTSGFSYNYAEGSYGIKFGKDGYTIATATLTVITAAQTSTYYLRVLDDSPDKPQIVFARDYNKPIAKITPVQPYITVIAQDDDDKPVVTATSIDSDAS